MIRPYFTGDSLHRNFNIGYMLFMRFNLNHPQIVILLAKQPNIGDNKMYDIDLLTKGKISVTFGHGNTYRIPSHKMKRLFVVRHCKSFTAKFIFHLIITTYYD